MLIITGTLSTNSYLNSWFICLDVVRDLSTNVMLLSYQLHRSDREKNYDFYRLFLLNSHFTIKSMWNILAIIMFVPKERPKRHTMNNICGFPVK